MKRALICGGLLLGSAFLVPLAQGDDHFQKRYYDRDGRDYHVYDIHEHRAYRFYLDERHRDYREFHRLKRNERQEYFRWRHDHPDDVLFKVDVR
jgi:hypothetical protein